MAANLSDTSQAAALTNYVDENRKFFDSNMDYVKAFEASPKGQEIARVISKAMLDAYEFDADSTIVMDYACGSGLVSQGLAPYCKTIVGVDISQGMVDYFNKRVADQGIPSEEMRAVCAELKGEEGELGGMKFDVIVCAQAYHHFPSLEDITKVLAHFLKPGGTLLVVDLARNDNGIEFHSHVEKLAESGASVSDVVNHEDLRHEDKRGYLHGDIAPKTHGVKFSHIVPHKGGFDDHQIQKAFEDAGLEEFEWSILGSVQPLRSNRKVELFLATGQKPE